MQPPSGGCVLKHAGAIIIWQYDIAATFGWLCVETYKTGLYKLTEKAATFGWLCVETLFVEYKRCASNEAATFGWLCVETFIGEFDKWLSIAATFGWLCVETHIVGISYHKTNRSHLRVAVC